MRYEFQVAGLGFLLESPIRLDLHPHYRPFLAQITDPDIIIRVCCDAPVYPEGAPVFTNGRLAVYATPQGWFREHRIWDAAEKSPENPCLVPESNAVFRLLIPAHRLAAFSEQNEFFWLLGPEAIFAAHKRLMLHAASVLLDGKAYLFSGPAGIGKSTHAALWAESFGAVPLNGDRTILEQAAQGFVAYGSPFCGSSDICEQRHAPLGGLCILEQASENEIEVLSPAAAFRLLYAQTIVNAWDAAQVLRLCDLLIALTAATPVFRLRCRPDAAAAQLCLQALQTSQRGHSARPSASVERIV